MAALAINPHVYANVGYDPLKDFKPVVNVAFPSIAIVVSPALKITTFKDLVAYSKAHPTELSYGTAGNGTAPHLNIEALKLQTGLVAQHVPYKSAPAVTTDVIAGRIQIQQDALSVLLPHINAGKVTAIAAGASKRLPQLPNVQSMSEAVPGFVPIVPWLGILVPAGTPPAIVTKINDDVHAILQQPDLVEKLATFGLTVTNEGPDAFAATLASDHARLGKLVKALAVKVD
jgi:tripartite-type tricarboxylate transporter receptor subunit TctC